MELCAQIIYLNFLTKGSLIESKAFYGDDCIYRALFIKILKVCHKKDFLRKDVKASGQKRHHMHRESQCAHFARLRVWNRVELLKRRVSQNFDGFDRSERVFCVENEVFWKFLCAVPFARTWEAHALLVQRLALVFEYNNILIFTLEYNNIHFGI